MILNVRLYFLVDDLYLKETQLYISKILIFIFFLVDNLVMKVYNKVIGDINFYIIGISR